MPDDQDYFPSAAIMEAHILQARRERLLRWGQPNCEYCGEPLETFGTGKDAFRVCGRCEIEAMSREYPDAQA